MPYDVQQLGSESLKQILLVLTDIKRKSELSNRRYLLLFRLGKLEGVEKGDQETILINLDKDKIIRESKLISFLTPFYLLRIDNAFFIFYNQVVSRLNTKKRKTIKSSAQSFPLDFNSHQSVLYFRTNTIKISLKNDRTNAHYVLLHIFRSEDDLGAEYPFLEIATDTFKDDYGKNGAWRKYYRACKDIQEKIRKATGIDDFLEFTSGKTGWVKINEKYLE